VIVVERSQALAYTTIAMQKLGYSKAEIEKVTNQMLEELKGYSEEFAEDRADEILFDEE
jgi:Holliday junction resolvasome RuvABC DNA-binding subunit